MDEILAWLRLQKGGVLTFLEFRQKAFALRAAEPESAALARLLADLSAGFVEEYDGEPLPVDVAERALARLLALVDKAARSASQGAAEKLDLLNEIGAAELT